MVVLKASGDVSQRDQASATIGLPSHDCASFELCYNVMRPEYHLVLSPGPAFAKGERAMRIATFAAGIVCLMLVPAHARERREAGPHQHGHGTLNIAIEGSRVSMELEVPGNDIVGFEQAAKTKAQRAAVAKAKSQLGAPLSLFRLPANAGCAVKEATVKIESEGKDDKKKAGHEHDDRGHSEFHAEYTLECGTIINLTSIEFPYFSLFKSAEELEVNVITPKGQIKFEVERNKPRLELSGLM
jgi:hypothetical protein